MSGFFWLLLLCAAAGMAYLVASIRRRRSEEQEANKSAEERAAEHALRIDKQAQQELLAGNLEAARNLFVEARRPGKAAQVAVREGKFELAGGLFEQDGRPDKALVAYRKAGLPHKVAALEQALAAKKKGDAADAAATGPVAQAQATVAGQPSATNVRPASPGNVAQPTAQASSHAAAAAPLASIDLEAESSRDSDDWLLEDGLLALPGLQAAARAPASAPPAPSQSAASRVALGVIALIKPRRPRAGVVEETVAVSRQRGDER